MGDSQQIIISTNKVKSYTILMNLYYSNTYLYYFVKDKNGSIQAYGLFLTKLTDSNQDKWKIACGELWIFKIPTEISKNKYINIKIYIRKLFLKKD